MIEAEASGIVHCVDVIGRSPGIPDLGHSQPRTEVGRPDCTHTRAPQCVGEVRRAQVLSLVGDEHRRLGTLNTRITRADRGQERGNSQGTSRRITGEDDGDRLVDGLDRCGHRACRPRERLAVSAEVHAGIGVRRVAHVLRHRTGDDDTPRRLGREGEDGGQAGRQQGPSLGTATGELAWEPTRATTREKDDGVVVRRGAARVRVMRVHGAISPDLPLLVVALEEEATHLHVSGLPILVTGVGKVNAAMSVAQTLSQHSPRAVVNVGTAGALRDGLAGTHVIGRVIQHDLDGAAIHALTGIQSSPTVDVATEGLTLATGDVFVSDPSTRARLAELAHLVDMEGYAVARAAVAARVPVTLVKQVSDTADDRAGRSWKESVEACAAELGIWVGANLLAE